MKFFKVLMVIIVFVGFYQVNQNDIDEIEAQSGSDKIVGVISGDTEGYTLFKTTATETVYLINGEGRIVHEWDIDIPSRDAVLRENGNIVVSHDPVNFGNPNNTFGPPVARIAEYTWDGQQVWLYEVDLGDEYQVHHGVEVMPNGNILMIAWEFRSREEAIALGRDPDDLAESLWPDVIFEYSPTEDAIVWEWNAWDHMIQDFDPDLPNYGVVSENPHKIDINFYEPDLRVEDWMHSNAVDYNPELDQIVMSVREFNEIWVIDHSISTEEARGSAGDLLYRWGNPRSYDRGTEDDRQLSFQHDAQWVPAGYPGEGNIIVFSNRHSFDSTLSNQAEEATGEAAYSKIVEITPPLQEDGTYFIDDTAAFGPEQLAWSYGENSEDYNFYSRLRSGVQRLKNGNTLIIQSTNAVFLEVTPEREVVWEYFPPFVATYNVYPNTEPGAIVFRSRQYAPDYPGLQGRDLTPDLLIEETASSSESRRAFLRSEITIEDELTQEIPQRYFVYNVNLNDVISINLESLGDNVVDWQFENPENFTVFENPTTGASEYLLTQNEGDQYLFVTSSDGSAEFAFTITTTMNLFDGVDEDTPRITSGSIFTSTVTEEDPSSLFVFWGNEGDSIETSMERGENGLNPVISLLDRDQVELVTESDEDENGKAIIEAYTLPYTGVYYVEVTYDENNPAPQTGEDGAFTFEFLILE